MDEPTYKRVAVLHRSTSYGPIKVYGPVNGKLVARGDHLEINGHRLTEAELRRGWYDTTLDKPF